MIHSMTGYGKAEAEYNGKKIHVEIKSLNSKNLDLNTRIATAYREKEMALRKLIAAELLRGKVDFTVWCEKASESAGSTINAATVADYVQQIQTVSAQVDGLAAPVGADLWGVLARLPELTQAAPAEELSDEEWTSWPTPCSGPSKPCKHSDSKRAKHWRKSSRSTSTT